MDFAMTPSLTPIEVRTNAARATMERFKDKPFAWGTHDCARMAAFHLRQLGHKPLLTKAGSYRSYLGARQALKRAGLGNLGDALDALALERIPPAAAVVGDIIEWPSENEIAALGVVVGNGRMLAFHPAVPGATILQPVKFVTAWRVNPL